MHFLKIRPEFYDAVKNGTKTYEVRKNDRNYKVGDTIRFAVKIGEFLHYINRDYVITHILTSEEFPEGIKDGYAILSIKKVEE